MKKTTEINRTRARAMLLRAKPRKKEIFSKVADKKKEKKTQKINNNQRRTIHFSRILTGRDLLEENI